MKLAFVILILLLAPGQSYAKDYRVGVLYWSDNIPCQVYMSKGLEAVAEYQNNQGDNRFELVIRLAGDGPEGIERQIRQMHELIDLGVDAIVVQPTDNAALVEPLIRANRHKIPVIAYDQYISQGELVSYITSDNYQAGYYNGEFIADYFKGKSEPINIVLVEYPHVSSTVERLDGFLDALSDYHRSFNILKSYTAVEPVSGALAGRAILKDFPQKGSVDVVFTVNDGGGLNVVNKLAEANRYDIVVATIDGDPDSIANIRQQRLTRIDTAQFCGPMGEEAMNIALNHLKGKPVAHHVLLPVYPITQETLANYPGWKGPIPPSFTKPWPSNTPDWHHQIKRD